MIIVRAQFYRHSHPQNGVRSKEGDLAGMFLLDGLAASGSISLHMKASYGESLAGRTGLGPGRCYADTCDLKAGTQGGVSGGGPGKVADNTPVPCP